MQESNKVTQRYGLVEDEYLADNTIPGELPRHEKNTPSKSLYHKNDVIAAIKERIDIVEYAKSQGLTIIPHGKHFSTKEHDSLVLQPNRRPDQMFSWNSRGRGGNVIQFAEELHGISQLEAIQHLRGLLNEPEWKQATPRRPVEKAADLPKDFTLPEKSKDGYQRMYAYLIKTRGIDPDIVKDLADKKMLYQDSKNNACFVGHDYDGKAAYCFRRGTNSDVQWRADAAASNKEVNFSYNLVEQPSDAKSLFVVESPIDAMSIMSILKANDCDYTKYGYISLGGTDPGALLYHIKQHPETDVVFLCQDNDAAGSVSRIKCAEQLREVGFKGTIRDKPPTGKDFNQDLTTLRAEQEVKKNAHLRLNEIDR